MLVVETVFQKLQTLKLHKSPFKLVNHLFCLKFKYKIESTMIMNLWWKLREQLAVSCLFQQKKKKKGAARFLHLKPIELNTVQTAVPISYISLALSKVIPGNCYKTLEICHIEELLMGRGAEGREVQQSASASSIHDNSSLYGNVKGSKTLLLWLLGKEIQHLA